MNTTLNINPKNRIIPLRIFPQTLVLTPKKAIDTRGIVLKPQRNPYTIPPVKNVNN